MSPEDPVLRAAVDIGTNSALLLVARVHGDGRLDVLEDHCMTPRLGEGLWRTGGLEGEAITRTLEVLRQFAERLERQDIPPGRCRVAATAVLRRAPDAAAFVERVKELCGLDLEILSEEEEARLGFEAVVGEGSAGDPLPACVVDVGGGSTEIVDRNGERRWSAPLGAVVLTERFLGLAGCQALEPGGWEALLAEIAATLSRRPSTAGAPAASGPVVALGGTPGNLACLDLGLEVFDHRVAEGCEIAAADALLWADRLRVLDLEERMDHPIEPGRAEILPAGLACLGLALGHLGVRRARASGRGLRYGLVRSLAP